MELDSSPSIKAISATKLSTSDQQGGGWSRTVYWWLHILQLSFSSDQQVIISTQFFFFTQPFLLQVLILAAHTAFFHLLFPAYNKFSINSSILPTFENATLLAQRACFEPCCHLQQCLKTAAGWWHYINRGIKHRKSRKRTQISTSSASTVYCFRFRSLYCPLNKHKIEICLWRHISLDIIWFCLTPQFMAVVLKLLPTTVFFYIVLF